MEWENRSTFVNIKTYPGKAEEVYEKLQKDPNTLAVSLTPGCYDVFCWINTRNMGEVYKWVHQVRTWPQVETTSSCPTYYGYWNQKPYQNKKYYVWMKVRTNPAYPNNTPTPPTNPYEYLKKCDGVTFTTSVPGNYDCYALYCTDDYDTYYEQVQRLRNQGYEVECTTPFQTYWNKQCDKTWSEYEKTSCQPNF